MIVSIPVSAETSGPRSKSSNIFEQISKLNPSLTTFDYVKRFFYQILGIYFPTIFLILYLLLFWNYQTHLFSLDNSGVDLRSPIQNLDAVFNYIQGHDSWILLILFIVVVVLLGEALNSITSKIDKISPIKRSHSNKIKEIISLNFKGSVKLPDYHPIRKTTWPIWLNITKFPVTFAHFDRYYVSILEQDKRTLAGRIGWLSFYRNMVAVFVIISILQGYLVYDTYVAGKNVVENNLWLIFVFVASIISIGLFYAGHHAQENAHRTSLFDAFKRNEFRKNLEIRYGEISLSLGIKEEYKNKAIEYFVDRWLLGVEQSMLSISSFVLTLVEEAYRIANQEVKRPNNSLQSFMNIFNSEARDSTKSFLIFKPTSKKQKKSKLEKIESNVKELLIDSYREWNVGGYTQVLFNCLRSLEYLNLELRQEAWQTIRGQYNLENTIRTEAAFKEVEHNVSIWGWINDKKNVGSDSGAVNNKKELDEVANIISKSTNPYFYNFETIMMALKELRMLRSKLSDFDKIDIWLEDNKMSREEITVNIDGKVSKVTINENIFKLDTDNKVLKVLIDGSFLSVDINKNMMEIDVQDRLSKIYCMFGANKYERAGLEAQRLLKELKISKRIIEEIEKEKKQIYDESQNYSLSTPKVK